METTFELSSRAIYQVQAFKTHTHEQWTIWIWLNTQPYLGGIHE